MCNDLLWFRSRTDCAFSGTKSPSINRPRVKVRIIAKCGNLERQSVFYQLWWPLLTCEEQKQSEILSWTSSGFKRNVFPAATIACVLVRSALTDGSQVLGQRPVTVLSHERRGGWQLTLYNKTKHKKTTHKLWDEGGAKRPQRAATCLGHLLSHLS